MNTLQHPDESGQAIEAEGSATLLSIVISLLLHRRLILGLALTFGIAAGTRLLLQDPAYTSTSTFTPQSAKGASDLGGLAAQLGVNVPGVDAEQSPAFYVDLVTSRAILGRIVDSPFVLDSADGPKARSVSDRLGVAEQNPSLRREEAIARLGKAIQSGFSQKTGVVSVSVTASDPRVARALTQDVISAVSRFNLTNRQNRASAERKFTEDRQGEAKVELHQAETRAEEFLLRNRQYRDAPQLALEYDRLTREIGLRQQLYNSLAQAYDKVKIDEVRNTPNITLINRAEIPVRPDPRGLVRWTVVALLLGMILGSVIALLLDYLAFHEQDGVTLEKFASIRKQAVADFKKPWRLLKS